MNFKASHWALLNLEYKYLDDGYLLTATTDVPCHLYCRITTHEPLKHTLPSYRRGTYLEGDIRFCFTVFEDNEQEEAGDTLTHTFIKDAWPVCVTKWFYFVGSQGGVTSVSETAIFKFHFPAPPPEPPGPIYRVFFAQPNNRTTEASALAWQPAHDASTGRIIPNWDDPNFALMSGSYLRGGWHYIWRSFLSFDTTPMPATARLNYATLSPYFYYKRGITTVHPIQLTLGVQHDPVIPADYGAQLPITTSGGSTAIPTLGYQPIPLNADGLSYIKPGGISKFCLRGNIDLLDLNPPAVYSNTAYYYSFQKGAGYRPTLTISYYPA